MLKTCFFFLIVKSFNSLTIPKVIKHLVPQITPQPKPILYVYDHCPFCVRVRLAFGLKNIKHEVRFLANDDVETPTALVGKKIAPIFQRGPQGVAMPESLDIIEVVDSDPSYGPIHLFKPMSERVDLKNWQNKVKEMSSISQRPRYMMVPLPEFHQRDAREAFVRNHPVSPYEKKDWQESLSSDQRWTIYVKCYEESLNHIDELSASLEELDKLIFSVDYCTVGGISLDDIDIWSRLRSLTLIKGLKWPTKLEAYLKNLSELGDLPLYFTLQV